MSDFRQPDPRRIWLPLQGPTGQKPKAPSAAGWQSPGYLGINVDNGILDRDWVGMRCDGLVVIDCDCEKAARAWVDRVGRKWAETYVRKTPRGWHFIYEWTEGSPTAPAVGILDEIDIRAGAGSQIVFYAPGYSDAKGDWDWVIPFRPEWLPERKTERDVGEGWTEMPHGRGDNVMTAIAGAMRKQGMAEKPIRTILNGINKLTMTESPMPLESISRIAHSVCRYDPDPDVDFEVDE